MILIENILYLKKVNPALWAYLKGLEGSIDASPVQVVNSKSGLPTLCVEQADGPKYIHSSYDPVREAEMLISSISADDIRDYSHFFFYGVGLGYHIEEFARRFPDKFISLYEPKAEVFCHYLSHRKIENLNPRNICSLYVVKEQEDAQIYSYDFMTRYLENVSFITLPSYERVFADEFEKFKQLFITNIHQSRLNRNTIRAWEKRWVVNSMLNFAKNLNNKNIFHCNLDLFKDKPVLLVAAGPSLEDEIENLRTIKENGSAYIFSVGSAIKTLVHYDILPDATITMDPSSITQLTFADLREKGITDLPLIYGTSVGFETLENYSGPQFYMVMDRDSTSPYYFRPRDKSVPLGRVNDAPSIAITALQLLLTLGFDPVILVGQNLAFRGDQSYAKGVEYKEIGRGYMLSDAERKNAIMVEDVNGKQILTNHSMYSFKKALENMIKAFGNKTVINTTRDGANIIGTQFMSLEELMNTHLTKPVVKSTWLEAKPAGEVYDIKYMKQQNDKMKHAMETLKKRLDDVCVVLERLGEASRYRREKQIANELNQLDRFFHQVTGNLFYRHFIAPLNQLETQYFGTHMKSAFAALDPAKKARIIIDCYSRYVGDCRLDMENVTDTLYPYVCARVVECCAKAENS